MKTTRTSQRLQSLRACPRQSCLLPRSRGTSPRPLSFNYPLAIHNHQPRKLLSQHTNALPRGQRQTSLFTSASTSPFLARTSHSPQSRASHPKLTPTLLTPTNSQASATLKMRMMVASPQLMRKPSHTLPVAWVSVATSIQASRPLLPDTACRAPPSTAPRRRWAASLLLRALARRLCWHTTTPVCPWATPLFSLIPSRALVLKTWSMSSAGWRMSFVARARDHLSYLSFILWHPRTKDHKLRHISYRIGSDTFPFGSPAVATRETLGVLVYFLYI